MKKFTQHTGTVLPLRIKDIDTDMIIPAQYLTSISRDGFGENLFRRLREQDESFPMNLKQFQGSSVIVADSNFGCGSSREHAVWAIAGAGYKVVIAKSFADIFSGNSSKNGLLLIVLDEKTVDGFLDRAEKGRLSLTIDLENQQVIDENREKFEFSYDSFRKYCLLNGLDDLDYILAQKKAIDNYWSG